jgi:hypothetical protein
MVGRCLGFDLSEWLIVLPEMSISSVLIEARRGNGWLLGLCRCHCSIVLTGLLSCRRSILGLICRVFEGRFFLEKVAKARIEFCEGVCRLVGAEN